MRRCNIDIGHPSTIFVKVRELIRGCPGFDGGLEGLSACRG